jgi:hypothetical protein
MDYSEKDIENYIIKHDLLEEEYGITLLCQQYKTDFGVIDLLGHDGNNLVVIELKKGVVDENAVGQIMRYVACMQELIKHYKNSDFMPECIKSVDEVYGLLIGSSSTEGVTLIVRQFDFLKFATHQVNMDVYIKDEEYDRHEESLERDCKEAEKQLFQKLQYIHKERLAEEDWQRKHQKSNTQDTA